MKLGFQCLDGSIMMGEANFNVAKVSGPVLSLVRLRQRGAVFDLGGCMKAPVVIVNGKHIPLIIQRNSLYVRAFVRPVVGEGAVLDCLPAWSIPAAAEAPPVVPTAPAAPILTAASPVAQMRARMIELHVPIYGTVRD